MRATGSPNTTYLPAAPRRRTRTNTYDYTGRRTARADADGATTLYGSNT